MDKKPTITEAPQPPKRFYRDAKQQELVFNIVRYLVNLTGSESTQLSKETLQLACDRYCYIVDPPDEPGASKY